MSRQLQEEVVENRPRLDDQGRETLDNSPVCLPLRFKKQDNLAAQVRDLVKAQFSALAEAQGFESFEEADDFNVGDDYEPNSPYELDDEQVIYDHRNDPKLGSAEVSPGGADPEIDDGVQPSRKNAKDGASRSKQSKRRASKSDDSRGNGEGDEGGEG